MMLAALPDGTAPLAVGTALALGALSLVLSPLLGEGRAAASVEPARGPGATDAHDDETAAIEALREIEFDRATGKLSDRDYEELKQRYTQAALTAMRAASVSTGAPAAVPAQVVDLAIARAHARQAGCTVCGPRPEPDAEYCSSCGRYLSAQCGGCGTSVELVGARFCTQCGEQLAA